MQKSHICTCDWTFPASNTKINVYWKTGPLRSLLILLQKYRKLYSFCFRERGIWCCHERNPTAPSLAEHTAFSSERKPKRGLSIWQNTSTAAMPWEICTLLNTAAGGATDLCVYVKALYRLDVRLMAERVAIPVVHPRPFLETTTPVSVLQGWRHATNTFFRVQSF